MPGRGQPIRSTPHGQLAERTKLAARNNRLGGPTMTDVPGRTTGNPTTRITVYPDGPLIVRGDFVLDDVDGEQIRSGKLVALCRCGRSAVKPLCDGSHKLAGGQAAAPAPNVET